MLSLWDYDVKKLKKSRLGQLLLLERQINYGIYRGDKDKIDLKTVKKNWHKLHLEVGKRRLLKFLIWKKLA